ncbi:sigma-70 family RNA polymerase sigma factor [Candidatus Phytoplasma fraxini]|uniref:DNA-directed RNA polymerase specialized sigma subunit n=1 Tax=Ash yellows phytoplasma TaxID=35780 RepID=A0ABZ2U8N6_ASHYP
MLRKELFKDFLKNKKNLIIRHQLINLHLTLVNKLVNQFKYYPRLLERQDLYQEGVLGLIKVLDKYVDLGYDFISYAKSNIKSEIRELIRKSHLPCIPQKTHKTNNTFFQEEKHTWHYQILNPHQLWLKQVNHELFLKKLKTKLNKKEFNVIRLNFGVPLGNINEDYQPSYSNQEITQILNLTLRQVETLKNIAINKLKK